MNINADFSKRATVHAASLPWVPSPMAGVDRRMLDRIGNEVARATSIVRYAPGSAFSSHVHTGGEEFLVIDGIFQDEHGDFPTGSYVRNPPQSSHTPRSDPGATILVKLWQFDPADRTHVNININEQTPAPVAGRDGVAVIPLYKDQREDVRIEIWRPGSEVQIDNPDGLEVFVLDGGFDDTEEAFTKHSWLRLPPGSKLRCVAGSEGARVFIKANHLRDVTITAPENGQ